MARSGDGIPQPGSVIRYSYLWADERARGREEGIKDRPSLVLALSVRDKGRTTEIMVVAMTHTPPGRPADGVPVPNDIKRRLGLDEAPTWIVTTEANVFVWPGPDLRPIPTRRPATAIYGRVPERFLSKIAHSYLANRTRQRRLVIRTA